MGIKILGRVKVDTREMYEGYICMALGVQAERVKEIWPIGTQ